MILYFKEIGLLIKKSNKSSEFMSKQTISNDIPNLGNQYGCYINIKYKY